ncbi:MAG: class I SAM-dependent methyltransferase [Gammaproteobacteria bacterium]|jgi:ubiquinone/menaquinone biosynthesis C-methylase UbiE|nr:class I SAM-dependent methyltransferase [Gammaproteobacteria bacterium]MDH3811138.1 class I SAM-dependent methyltransferase [Gammaproteobacteria bacterium]
MSDRDYWERHARNYDASLRWVLGRTLPRMLELASESVRGRQSVLEVAAGTGIVTSAIAETADSIVATDYAAAMVEALKQRVQDAGLKNVTCEQADVYALPYSDGEFDAVVAANVLHLVPDLPAAIRALRNVTKPGGMLVTPTFCHDETKVSWLVSRLLAISGFPGYRRFTMQSLRIALEENGVQITRAELLPGLIPIGFVEGVL